MIYRNTLMTLQLLDDGHKDEYRELVNRFLALCENSHLVLNTNKTKETIVDFRKTKSKSNTVSIQGEKVEVIEDYRYLGFYLDNRLDWRCNTEVVYKKGHNRWYFFRKLRSFNVCTKILHIFYKSVVDSKISIAAICCGSSIRARYSNKLKVVLCLGLLWSSWS